MADPKWLQLARKDIGTKEIPGAKHNPRVLRYWTLIRAPFTDDETPWCAGFVGAKLEEAGIKSTRSAWAKSYAKWGDELEAPIPGCIVVFHRGANSGHVGFFVGYSGRNLLILGGNQGDAVNIKPFSPDRVVKGGYRWPKNVPLALNAEIEYDDSNAPVSQRESFANLPPEEEEKGGLMDKIEKWWAVIGTAATSILGSLYDVRIAGLLILAGLVIFAVIWFFPRSKRRKR